MYIIETDELQKLIELDTQNWGSGDYPDLKIVNATWYLPHLKKDAWQEHLDARITNETVYFDHSAIADPNAKLPVTLPDREVF
jgi:3-mercaptopyruvate sulfurtransferase SseA